MQQMVIDLQLGFSQGIRMINYEAHDKMVEGMRPSSYNNISGTFN